MDKDKQIKLYQDTINQIDNFLEYQPEQLGLGVREVKSRIYGIFANLTEKLKQLEKTIT